MKHKEIFISLNYITLLKCMSSKYPSVLPFRRGSWTEKITVFEDNLLQNEVHRSKIKRKREKILFKKSEKTKKCMKPKFKENTIHTEITGKVDTSTGNYW